MSFRAGFVHMYLFLLCFSAIASESIVWAEAKETKKEATAGGVSAGEAATKPSKGMIQQKDARGRAIWKLYEKQIFFQPDGRMMQRGEIFTMNPLANEHHQRLREIPEAVKQVEHSKVWMGLLGGAVALSLVAAVGAFVTIFVAPGAAQGIGAGGAVFYTSLGAAFVAFPVGLFFAVPLGLHSEKAFQIYNQRLFMQGKAGATAQEFMLWSLLNEKRIRADEWGWVRKGSQRLPALSAWHETLLKEYPKAQAQIRSAWRMRLASIILMSAGGVTMLGGITFFSIDAGGTILGGGGRVLVPFELAYGLWAGGFIAFGAGVVLEIFAQSTYRAGISAHNHEAFRRLSGQASAQAAEKKGFCQRPQKRTRPFLAKARNCLALTGATLLRLK